MYDIAASMTNDEDFELRFIATDSDDEPLPVDDWEIEFVLMDKSGCQLLSYSSPDDDEIDIDTDTSEILIVIDNDRFNAWDCGTYKMACRYTDTTTGRTTQLFMGELQITEGGF